MRVIACLIFVLQFLAGMARADAVDDLFAKHLAAGSYEAGADQILSLSSADPARAAGAAGALQFAEAIEHLGQSLYRFGLAPPRSGAAMSLPVLRFPVPPNPKPEKLDYRSMRAILEALVNDLDEAEASLARLGDKEIALSANIAALRVDFNGDGKLDLGETMGDVMVAMLGAEIGPADLQAMDVRFDTADIYWMRGYGRFISSFAQFLLAHDFHETFEKTFHLFFPAAGLEIGGRLAANRSTAQYLSGEIGDLVAFVHLVNWPVVDQGRLADVRSRLLGMTALSASSWAAARRETGDVREWLPNARQKGAMTGAPLSDETIDSWLAVMTEFGGILEGRKLLPHWRFDRGLNVRRMFAESKRFDLVLLVAGTDAVPYLEDGPISGRARWNELMQAFQGNFLGYALWFN